VFNLLRLLTIAAVILVVVYLVTPARVFTPSRQKSKRLLEDFVAQNGGRNDDPEVKRLIHRIVGRFVPKVRNQLDDIEFTVVLSRAPNACAIGANDICVTQGLIDLLDGRDGYIAPIIAHELGHILCGHEAARWKDSIFLNIGAFLLARFLRSGWLTGILTSVALSRFSRAQEFEADAFSVRLIKAVGYNPALAADALEKVTAYYKEHIGNDAISRYFASHPPLDQRLDQMKQIAQEA
jgi:putative metalloprotease